MTTGQLQTIEAELQQRGYRKWTTAVTSTEDWAWFKTHAKETDEDGETIGGYQIAFRVWHHGKYPNAPADRPYGFDFWTSPLGSDSRMDFTVNWQPFCDIDTFEAMAKEFYLLTRKFTDSPNKY